MKLLRTVTEQAIDADTVKLSADGEHVYWSPSIESKPDAFQRLRNKCSRAADESEDES